MRKLSSLLFILIVFSSPSNAADKRIYEVYDKGEIHFNEMLETDMNENTFIPIGEPKTISVLKYSKAELMDCPKYINDKIFSDYMNLESRDVRIVEFQNLRIQKCVKISYANTRAYVVQFFMNLNLVNATSSQEITEPIIWIGLENNGDINQVLFKVSDSRFLKGINYKIEGVADVTGDGNHDIIINDRRYAGRGYIILTYDNDKLIMSEVSGASWD